MVAHRYLVWGVQGAEQVDGEVVPSGEVWLIQTAGIATTDNRALDYMLQHVVPPGWFVPVCRSPQASSTPVLALDRPIILQAGEFLKTRVNGGGSFTTMALLYSGWKFPVSELASLLKGSGTSSPDPNFVAACQAAATALAAIK